MRFPVSKVLPTSRGSRSGRQTLSQFFAPLFEAVDEAAAQGGDILTHCNAGSHRAGLTGCSLAMHYLRLGPEDAAKHVHLRRVVTHVNGDFFKSSASVERDAFGLSSG